MKDRASKIIGWVAGLSFAVSAVAACNRGPEVGSPEWCEAELEAGKMDGYGEEEVMTYAKHCMLAN